MKSIFALAFISVLSTAIFSQPLNGSYTVGGQSPDFATLQNAAHALFINGISGPVFFNIRPGTYMKQGNPGPVMRLDSLIAGVSPTNRITFQPDAQVGGNRDNTILQIDCDVNTDYNNDREIFFIKVNFVTIRNLTIKDADSLDSPARFLLRIEKIVFQPPIDELIVDGCRFIGTPYYSQGQQYGTDYGIYSEYLATGIVENNKFTNLMRAVGLDVETGGVDGNSVTIENNKFEHLYLGFTGAGSPIGSAIQVEFPNSIIRKNFISNSSGSIGINVVFPITAEVEANYVSGSYINGQLTTNLNSASQDRSDSLLIFNNVLIGSVQNGTLQVYTRNTKIYHNTIVHSGSNSIAFHVYGSSCSVINNIFLAYGGWLLYEQLESANLISDHNLFYSTCSNFARSHQGTYYTTLESYKAGTGLDVNSKFSDVTFDFDSLGIHLDECQAQNNALDGIPLLEVPFDFYGAQRDSVKPFVGAVEGVRLPYDMYGEPFRAALTGFPLSISAGNFDNSSFQGIVVPDWDNRKVLLFHNNGATRTFTNTGTIFTGFRPTAVKLYDLDNDGNQDLIIGGDTSFASLEVCWGNGSGSSSNPELVQTTGRVRSIKDGPRYLDFSTIMFTEDDGFLPDVSYLGFVYSDATRNLCHDVLRKNAGSFIPPDTIHTVMADFERTDLDNDLYFNVIALAIDFPSPVVVFRSIHAIFDAAGSCYENDFVNGTTATEFQFGTSSYLGNNSNIVSGDFDGDLDVDFVSTGANDNNLIFIKNNGNFTFNTDTIPTAATRGLVKLDYENDGDLDLITTNDVLDSLGITVFLNDGVGNFEEKRNCFLPFASGHPDGIVAADFDQDGNTDIAIVSRTPFGGDSLFVLYNLGGFNQTTDVKEVLTISDVPENFELSQNYPNPFNPTTTIRYSLPFESDVEISVFNILGEKVRELVNEQMTAGNHSVNFNASNLASGIYIYTIEAKTLSGEGNFITAKKMVLLK